MRDLTYEHRRNQPPPGGLGGEDEAPDVSDIGRFRSLARKMSLEKWGAFAANARVRGRAGSYPRRELRSVL